MASRCQENCLQWNIGKTMDLVVELRRQDQPHAPHHHQDCSVKGKQFEKPSSIWPGLHIHSIFHDILSPFVMHVKCPDVIGNQFSLTWICLNQNSAPQTPCWRMTLEQKKSVTEEGNHLTCTISTTCFTYEWTKPHHNLSSCCSKLQSTARLQLLCDVKGNPERRLYYPTEKSPSCVEEEDTF